MKTDTKRKEADKRMENIKRNAGICITPLCNEKGIVDGLCVKHAPKITLSGFGDFSENPDDRDMLATCAKEHGVEFYPTYYDHELKGTRSEIEAITKELWSMPADQWAENALYEGEIRHEHVFTDKGARTDSGEIIEWCVTGCSATRDSSGGIIE